MKKKLFIAFLTTLLGILCAIGLVACGGRSGNTHTHTYSAQWSYDENYHWHKATCEHTDEINGRAAHSFNGNVCSVCNYEKNGSDDPNNSQKVFKTVTFNLNGGNGSLDDMQFAVGEVMTTLPSPTRDGYTFICWEIPFIGEEFTAASVMPNRDLQLSARWEKVITGYSDNYVSFKPSSEGVKDAMIREMYRGEVDKFVYVEITSDDLGGIDNVGKQNNFNLRTLEGMQYAVKSGYTWAWYQGNFDTPNGAQRFTLRYGSNIQFVTISDNSGVVQQTYLLDIYVKHDYYINLYTNIFEQEPYDSVRVIENDRFSADTKVKESNKFEFDSRVYFNTEKRTYEKFVYSTAITKNWNLYQTYKDVTIPAELNDGVLNEDLVITPYKQYFTLPSPEKAGYDFLGWQLANGDYLTNVQGYSGVNYISEENNPSKLTAVYSEKKYYYTFENDKLNTHKTVPIVTYTDKTMRTILDIEYTPYNTDCVLPVKTAQGNNEIFTEWLYYYLSDKGEFSTNLSSFDFDKKVISPIALAPNTYATSDYVVPLNGELTFRETGNYRMYLPANKRYQLTISSTSSVTLTINQYGSTSNSKTLTVRSGLPQTVNLDYYVYNLGSTVYSHGYVTFKVTSLNGSFTAKLVGSTAGTSGTPIVTNEDNTANVGEDFTVSLVKPGYAFDGWYEEDTKISENEFITMQDREMEITAKWVVCPITLEKSIAEAGTVSGVSGTTAIGEEVTITAATKNGYTWDGWYNGETLLTKELEYTFTMPAENATYTAKWIKITVDRNNTSAGSVTSLSGTYSVGDSATLTATTSSGYTWVGWYNEDVKLTSELSYTFEMPAENATYTAKWAKLTLARNNSSAGSISTLSSKYTAGEEVTVTANTYSGYTFLGWYNGETLLSTNANYTFEMPAENATYTATWTSYTLTTARNDNNAGTVTTKNAVRTTAGQEVTITATTNDGYTWLGWYNGETLLSTNANYTFNMPSQNVTYTAKWANYTLTTAVNDLKAGTITTKNAVKTTAGKEVTIVAITNQGYTWLGWYNGDILLSTDASYTFNMPSQNVTYTAKWSNYTVSIAGTEGGSVELQPTIVAFNLNYGIGVVSQQIVTESQGLSYPEIPTRNGYVFRGWYTDSSCTSLYDFSAQVLESITLFAGWQEMASSYCSRNYIDIVSNYNSTSNAYSYSNSNATSSQPYYTYFSALNSGTYRIYYKNGSSGTNYGTYLYIYNATQGSVLKTNANITSTTYSSISISANAGDVIYIRTYRNSYSSTFYMYVTGGSYPTAGGIVGDVTSVKVAVGQEYTVSASTDGGYTFIGWFDGETKLSKDLNYKFVMPEKNVSVKAKWMTCPITIINDNPDCGSISMPSTTILGEPVTLTATPKIGYTFVGWFNGERLVSNDLEFTFNLSEEVITYTAKWTYYTLTVNSSYNGSISGINYKVVFDLNGGEGTTPQTQIISSTTGMVYPDIPKRAGYVFTGWYRESACATIFDFSTNIEEDIILYAGWHKITTTGYSVDVVDIVNNNNSISTAYSASTYNSTSSNPKYVYFAAYASGQYTIHYQTEKSSSYSAKIYIYNATKRAVIQAEINTACAYNEVTFNATAGDVIYVRYYRSYEGSSSKFSLFVIGPTLGVGGKANDFNHTNKVQQGDVVTLNAGVRNGYTFIGWYNGDTLVCSDLKYTFAMPSENLNLEAKWCKVTIAQDSIYAGSVTTLTDCYKVGDTVTVTATNNSGYSFVGWFNGNVELTKDLSYTFVMPNEDRTFTAKWTSYTITINSTAGGNLHSGLERKVTFDLNGSDGVAPQSQTITSSSGLIYPSNPVREGYVFRGWYTERDCVNWFNFNASVDKDITLYAGWYKINTSGKNIIISNVAEYSSNSNRYSISTYNSNSYNAINIYFSLPTAGNPTLYLSQQTSGSFCNLIEYVENVTSNTVILDKYDSGNKGSTNYKFTANAGDIILIKVYQRYGYNAGGSSGNSNIFYFYLTGTSTPNAGGTLAESIQISNGENLSLEAVTDNSYTFLGWYDGDKLLSSDLEYAFVMGNENINWTLKWMPCPLQIVSNNADGGSVYMPTTTIAGKDVTISAVTNAGYTFVGWYDGDTLLSRELQYTFTMPTVQTKYTAKWIKVDVESNISDVGSVSVLSDTYKYGDEVTVEATTVCGNAYNFAGWYNGNTLLSKNLQYTFTMPSQNVVYTAKWEVKEELSNFNFVCTSDSITITGIKNNTVSEIIVPDNVTEISEGAFAGCSNLQKLVIPFVGKEAIPSNYNDYVYPLGYIFGRVSYDGATRIGQRDVSHNGTLLSGVDYYIPLTLKDIEVTQYNVNYYGFSGCSMLRSVILPSNVTSIEQYVFEGCTGLTSVVIPDSVTNIKYSAFSGCRNLMSVTIGNNVTSIGNEAFYNCYHLLDVYNKSSLELISGSTDNGYVAYYAKAIRTQESGSKLATDNDGFVIYDNYIVVNYIGNKTDITIPASVTSIGDYAFYYCSGLTSVTIPTNVTSIGDYAFYRCIGLTSIAIPDSVTSIGVSAFCECEGLTSVTLPNKLTSIENSTFYRCIGLTSITIPDSVTSIGVSAFCECKGLTSVTLPNKLTSIGNSAFSSCSKLASITLPSNLESIGHSAFSSCSGLTSIAIPNSVTSIGVAAFGSCSNLTRVYITDLEAWCGISFNSDLGGDPFNTEYNLYLNGTIITDLVIPDSVTSIGAKTFAYCSGLTSVVIPDGVTSIGAYAFYHCSGLTSVVIPDSVTSIGDGAFRSCSGVTRVTLGNGLTSIGSGAFCWCDKLVGITIPDSVTSIGSGAFAWCSKLVSVIFKNTSGWSVSTSSGATSGTNISSSNLSNISTAATYLRSTYSSNYWVRS